jgi:transposase
MAQQRLPMHKIRDVLRLAASGLSQRQIGMSLGIGRTAIAETLRRAGLAGVVWPLPDNAECGDDALEQRLYPPASGPKPQQPLPDWPAVRRELSRKGVTLYLLWEEYRATYPEGYSRSRFCSRYREWEGRLTPTMRQTHVAGEKLFVDYAGTTLAIHDAATGGIITAQLFVAALGASSYTYAEATLTQTLPDWLGSHARAFAFFGGVPALVVSDNLKSGITKACFFEPAVNRAYAGMATHYDTAVVPARPYKPRDKGKVEAGVLLATRWIVAKLRNAKFFSLNELNAAVAGCVAQLNDKVSRHLGASRRALFVALDAPVLKALPTEPYVYAEWKECRVGQDYHIEVDQHFYSVPNRLLRQKLWVRMTAGTVEAFHRGERVAAHIRAANAVPGTPINPGRRHTTLRDHMPVGHQRYADWTPARIKVQAEANGPQTAALVALVLRDARHPDQGLRACIGILGHAKSYGPERLEAACARAVEIGARSYTSVTSILKTNLDRHRPAQPQKGATDGPVIVHANIRGPRYFH